ncbi:MAG: hypothetical protein SOZ36_09760 [Atopobiaceae bacterium]|nr:hypothetical protein [Atopobiaceae bacterium]
MEKDMVQEYRREMGRISLTPEQRERMAQAVASAASGRADGARDDARPAPEAGRGSARRTRRARGWLARAAVAAGVVLAVGAGAHAYASGQLVGVASAIDDVFFGATAPTEVAGRVGRPVNAAATSGGVTISADAIVGDEHNYVVVYSIRRADGQPLGEVTTDEGGTLLLDGQRLVADFDQGVDGALGSGGASYFYDADPQDDAIQLVVQATTDADLVGATVRTSFHGISAVDPQWQATRTVASGAWDLKFKLDYESYARELAATGDLTVAGTPGSVRSVSVSPVAVTVDYAVDGVEQAPASGQWSPSYLDLGDIVVTMADGTSFSVPSGAATARVEGGRTVCEMGAFLDRVVDPDQVVSVSFAGVTARP